MKEFMSTINWNELFMSQMASHFKISEQEEPKIDG